MREHFVIPGCNLPRAQPLPASNLAGIPGVIIYLDDIVMHRATTHTHDEHLKKILDTLAKHKLTLHGDKCLFAIPVIEFVGFKLSEQGISLLQSNTDATESIPEPTMPAQVASFLGMTGYYLVSSSVFGHHCPPTPFASKGQTLGVNASMLRSCTCS